MEPIYSTDYLAFIPHAAVVGFAEPDKKSGALGQRANAAVADLALAGLAATSAITVALVIMNWSR
jgi:hypothetical protein